MIKVNFLFFIFLSSFIFIIGLTGIILNKRNILLTLLSIELILLAININFIFYSIYIDDFFGQLFALYILTVAAAESAIGLTILVIYYRVQNTLDIRVINLLQA
uniref:NADH dehydrogenase subunit 4L n=1 Tax=Thraustochytrium aureum TaxID=42467 RepID=Q9G4B9_9STRA|nr:NADH dehydrogenase subunit 4L [Thraustochytrium aureum]